MVRLTAIQRERAIGMLQAGRSLTDVSVTFQVHKSTICRLWRRFRATDTTDDRPRAGRPRVTTPQQDRHIRLTHLRDRFRTATETALETPGTHNDRICASTVRNRLRDADLRARRPYRGPLLTPVRRRNRQQCVRDRVRWPIQRWRSVLFTDESRFRLFNNDGRARVWRRRGERFANACITETDRFGGPSVMVWAGIHHGGKTDLQFIAGNLTGMRYRDEILQPIVVPYVRRHHLTLQQDNARPHTARICGDFLRQQAIDVLPWPAYSPDLSPIEHLWDNLDRRLRRRNPLPVNAIQLRDALQEEWDNIPQHQVQRLVCSMRRRCQAVLDMQGGHTRY